MSARPTKDQYFIEMARVVATRSTCCRRKVGCVMVDFDDRVLCTGYNGNPPQFPHCIDNPCEGAHLPSGTGLDICGATHAEINALCFCPDIKKIKTIYVTTSPCSNCIKALLNTSAERIVFEEEYASSHNLSKEWWVNTAKRKWEKFNNAI